MITIVEAYGNMPAAGAYCCTGEVGAYIAICPYNLLMAQAASGTGGPPRRLVAQAAGGTGGWWHRRLVAQAGRLCYCAIVLLCQCATVPMC